MTYDEKINQLIDEVFTETVTKSSENFEVASASKTTADAAIASAPKAQNDESRGAGRPKQISDVPENDEDGKRDGQYDASIAQNQAPVENPEVSQSKSIDQNSSAGRLGEGAKMKDPRLSKSISEEEYAEFEAFKKSKAEAAEAKKQEEIKKSEDLKKAELESLIKSSIEAAIKTVKEENETLKKSLNESSAILKAMAAQPVRAKSVTGIDALEKSTRDDAPAGAKEFTKEDKLNAAEALVMRKSLPIDAVVELENTGTVYNKEWRAKIEAELQKQN